MERVRVGRGREDWRVLESDGVEREDGVKEIAAIGGDRGPL